MKPSRLTVALALLFSMAGCARLHTVAPEPWWAWPPGTRVTTCGFPAVFRIDGRQPHPLGSCAAALTTDPAVVDVRVGQELDLHMTTEMSNDGASSPLYPLPSSPDESVLRLLGSTDDGSTARYGANGAGTVILMTTGWCIDDRTGGESQGACPILRVQVTP